MVSRAENLQRLQKETFDILVIGGGATGAGIVLDAALRGLHVALVECGDFSSGTSSKSTKLIHGGVRYLERVFTHLDFRQFSLVRQTLKERYTLLRIAPHLTHVIPIIIPVYSKLEAIYYSVGIKIYDFLAGNRGIGRSSFLSKEEVMRDFPYIDAGKLIGGVQLYDGQFDDARMNIAIILSAIKYGAAAANYVEVIGFDKQNQKNKAAIVKDHLSGQIFSIQARSFVNATGPLSCITRRLDNPKANSEVLGSLGTHFLIEKQYTESKKGLLIPRTSDGRILFMLPWKGLTLVGTTDIPTDIRRDPKPTSEEILYLLEHVRHHLGVNISEKQITAAWAGIRPLLSDQKGNTAAVPRGFKVIRDPSGLYSIIGGKWTSYRKMAESFLDIFIKDSEITNVRPCSTETTLLMGGEGDLQALIKQLAEDGWEESVALHLVQSYGNRANEVIRLSRDVEDGKKILSEYPFLLGEVIYGIRDEMACTVMDVLDRRLRLATLDQRSALYVAPKIIELMAKELGWSKKVQQEELVRIREGMKQE